MNQRHENSLLFSLAELRAIEDARIAEEIEADRNAREAAEAARAAELARAEQEKSDRERDQRAAKERALAQERAAERRERLALEEAERLARIAADERLAQQRLALEASVARPVRSWRTPIAGLVLAVLAGGLGVAYMGAAKERDQDRAALTSLEKRFDVLEKESASLVEKTESDAVVIARLESELREAKKAAKAPQVASTSAKAARPRPRPRPTATTQEPIVRPPSAGIDIDTSETGDPLAGLPAKKKKRR